MNKVFFFMSLFSFFIASGQKSDSTFLDIEDKAFQLLSPSQKRLEEYKEFYSSLIFNARVGDVDAMCDVAPIHINFKDYSSAIIWLNRAIDKGSARALHLFGNMYKFGMGVELDYYQAYSYFLKSAEKDWPNGVYSKGYMEYKGLGCEQNYKQAFQTFLKGARLNSSSSMYMFGLCYRNGYGVERDKNEARFWLNKSASMGYPLAEKELEEIEPENNILDIALASTIDDVIKLAKTDKFPVEEFTKITGNVNADDIHGKFRGFLIEYDWSGNHIIDVVKLNLDIKKREGNLILGEWIEGEHTVVPFYAILNNDAQIVFQNMSMIRSTHYVSGNHFGFETMGCDAYTVGREMFLNGTLRLFSLDMLEPDRPLRVVLRKIIDDDAQRDFNYGLSVSPNPFRSEVNVKFELSNVSTVKINIFSSNGSLVYSSQTASLLSGEYVFPLELSFLHQGMYSFVLHVDEKSVESIFVNKAK